MVECIALDWQIWIIVDREGEVCIWDRDDCGICAVDE